jgi:hypothetical protein
MITSTEPTFLYPQSRQFLFDEVTDEIVRALEDRNGYVPGITVEFDTCGTGAAKYRLVRRLQGVDFRLMFGRQDDMAAVAQLTIPRKHLRVYHDESGPTFYVYAGWNWRKDKQRFLDGSHRDSELNGERCTYLKYEGARNGHSGQRPPHLLLDFDHGSKWRQPKVYDTDEIFAEFTQWLRENLLAKITAYPRANEKIDIFYEEIEPFPSAIGPIFCFGNWRDAERVQNGQRDPSSVTPSELYGFTANGEGIATPAMTRGHGTVPEAALGNYKWCGLGEVTPSTDIRDLDIPGLLPGREDDHAFSVTPNRANGIYVVDDAAWWWRRSELLSEIKSRDYLTVAELREVDQARAQTFVPISQYTGGYMQPIILVKRELDLNEVRLVSGPRMYRRR